MFHFYAPKPKFILKMPVRKCGEGSEKGCAVSVP